MHGGDVAIGETLTRMRERRGWSMGQLADRSGVSRAAISRIESGQTPSPGAKTLGRLAASLGVQVSEITGERPMPRRQPQILEGAVGLPVLKRRVHAGGESFWDDTDDTVFVPRQFRDQHPRAMVAVVDGECMRPHIDKGERVIFDPDRTPVNGQMVVVTTLDGQMLLKWFRIDGDGLPFLRSADGEEIRPNGARVVGVVLEVHRGAVRDPQA